MCLSAANLTTVIADMCDESVAFSSGGTASDRPGMDGYESKDSVQFTVHRLTFYSTFPSWSKSSFAQQNGRFSRVPDDVS